MILRPNAALAIRNPIYSPLLDRPVERSLAGRCQIVLLPQANSIPPSLGGPSASAHERRERLVLLQDVGYS